MSYENFLAWRDQLRKRPVLSIIVPTYNEEIRILPTLASIAVVVSGIEANWELIVADDGSRDDTVRLVQELGWANLKVVAHANTGKGGAVRRGMLAARGQYLLFTDADNSTPIEELPKFLAAVQQKADIVIGSRAFAGANEENKSLIRTLGSRVIRTLAQFGLGLPIKDTQCGFKLFRRDAALRLCALQRMEGFSFDLEWLYLARKHSFRVMELPVRWFDAPGSKVQGLRDGLRFIRDMAKIIHNDFMGLYRSGGEQDAPSYHQHLPTK
ncbi:MAG: hypothetical protein RLZZ156_349 [Deinococcota bacterium]|jgi:dolichyl-phosphate beta-glucosyltransferase